MTIDTNQAAVIVALIAALASIVAAALGLRNSGKLNVIHVLVNSNLSAIKNDLARANEELDRLRARMMGEEREK